MQGDGCVTGRVRWRCIGWEGEWQGWWGEGRCFVKAFLLTNGGEPGMLADSGLRESRRLWRAAT